MPCSVLYLENHRCALIRSKLTQYSTVRPRGVCDNEMLCRAPSTGYIGGYVEAEKVSLDRNRVT